MLISHTLSLSIAFSISLCLAVLRLACAISRFYVYGRGSISARLESCFLFIRSGLSVCLGLHLRHYTFSLNHHHHYHVLTPLFSSLLSLLLCFFCFWLDVPEAVTFATTVCYAGQGVQRWMDLGGKGVSGNGIYRSIHKTDGLTVG